MTLVFKRINHNFLSLITIRQDKAEWGEPLCKIQRTKERRKPFQGEVKAFQGEVKAFQGEVKAF